MCIHTIIYHKDPDIYLLTYDYHYELHCGCPAGILVSQTSCPVRIFVLFGGLFHTCTNTDTYIALITKTCAAHTVKHMHPQTHASMCCTLVCIQTCAHPPHMHTTNANACANTHITHPCTHSYMFKYQGTHTHSHVYIHVHTPHFMHICIHLHYHTYTDKHLHAKIDIYTQLHMHPCRHPSAHTPTPTPISIHVTYTIISHTHSCIHTCVCMQTYITTCIQPHTLPCQTYSRITVE